MSRNLPTLDYYNLSKLEVDTDSLSVDMNQSIVNTLTGSTLSTIKNAFSRGVLISENGWPYIDINQLKHLLRTSNSGAENYYRQKGIDGLVSGSQSHKIVGKQYISGSDFTGLLDARIRMSNGKTRMYLKYVRCLYDSILETPNISALSTIFLDGIEKYRNGLKNQRINTYSIEYCEFSGEEILDYKDVEFAHVDSVATSPLRANDINNGVIIFAFIHRQLTIRGIHDFEGMYDFCEEFRYDTAWADEYI